MSAPLPNSTPFRVLLLDDNPSTRNLAKLVLEKHLPCKVALCHSSEALAEAARVEIPDLFLLDVSIGIDPGIDLCQALKQDASLQAVPIVFLSTYKEPAKRVAALKAGGADYVDKPFYPEELVARVQRQIELHRLRLDNLHRIAEQQALLRVLCHDLVNPLFGAHGLLELKLESAENPDPDLKLILGCCQSAMDIIGHVRSEHSLLAADKQFETASCSLREAVDESERTLRPQFDRKGVHLETRLACEARLPIKRVVLVHSVLNNLLTNALKFTHSGGNVSVSARRETLEVSERVAIEVRDSGIGMPAEILSRVFDEDAKVSRQGTGGEQGTGFGMPLIKRYVEASGGTIELKSISTTDCQPGQRSGTLARLSFPCASEPPQF